MIVACPKCKSKYNVPEGKIAPNGTKVRCARCKYVFTVMPPANDFEKELADLTAGGGKPAPAAPPKPDETQAARPQPAAAQTPEPKAPEPKTPEPKAPAAKAPEAEPESGGPQAAATEGPETSLKKMPWEANGETEASAVAETPAAGPAAGEPEPPAEESSPEGGPDKGGAGEPGAEEPGAEEPPSEEDGAGEGGAGGSDFDAALAAEAGNEPDAANGEDLLGDFGDEMSGKPPAAKKPARKKLFLLLLVLVVLLAAVGAGVYFRSGAGSLPFFGPSAKKASVDAAERVKDIALRNVRQYYIPNEKTGNLFVVEGKAVNNFPTPKERIKVEISLYDEKGRVLATKQLLCGNTLSQFQLQVQSANEINASLSSEVGVLTSNTFLKPGMDTPFMAVFFKPPQNVKEFGVKVVDAQDPKK